MLISIGKKFLSQMQQFDNPFDKTIEVTEKLWKYSFRPGMN